MGSTIGIILALVSACSWSAATIFFKKAESDVSPHALTLSKNLIMFFFLAIVLAFSEGIPHLSQNVFLSLGMSGFFGIAIGDTLFFLALQYLTAPAIVLLALSGQIFTLILARIFLGEIFSSVAYLGIIMVMLGITYAIFPKREEKKLTTKGILLGIASFFAMAVGMVMAKKGLEETSSLVAVVIRMFFGILGILLINKCRKISVISQLTIGKQAIRPFLLALLIASFGGFWASHAAIKYLSVSLANILNASEPIFATLIMWYFYNQKVSKTFLLGLFASLLGMILILWN